MRRFDIPGRGMTDVTACLAWLAILLCMPAAMGQTLGEVVEDIDAIGAELRRPNILFLMADDWSAPHASILGAPLVETPTFDRVAREGVLFNHAFVSAPSCTPSRLSIATGQWHWRLTDGESLGGSIHEGVPVYAELLQEAGYEIGFSRKGATPSQYTFTQRDPFGPRFKNFETFFAGRTNGQPFCFWYGAGEPHRPYRFGESEEMGMDASQVALPVCLPDTPTTRRDFADYLARVQRFDTDCARMIGLLEAAGELENTILVMSGDNGLPFPRCKATLYDTGTHVPLAIRWGAQVGGGRRIDDFVSLTDLAPTFLAAAGLVPPPEMTGQSLLSTLTGGQSGQVDPARTYTLTGMERHVYLYPCRGLRTQDFLYIRNFEPSQWPTGQAMSPQPPIDFSDGSWPNFVGAFSYNVDPSPTKQLMLDQATASEIVASYQLAFGPRSEEELFDLRQDPDQLHNVASDAAYSQQLMLLRAQLAEALTASEDPFLDSRNLTPAQP